MPVVLTAAGFLIAEERSEERVHHLAKIGRVCQSAAMPKPDPRAGGCFFAILILAGFFTGMSLGNPLAGTLWGFGAGALIALIVWLTDRQNRG